VLLVLLTLGIYMRADGTQARPSLATLGAKTGLHPGSVGRHLRWARDRGWLIQVARGHRRGDGIAVASVHRAAVPELALARNESDVERDVEILNRADDPLNRAADPSLPRTGARLSRPSATRSLTSSTALCDRCDDDGFELDEINTVCRHPLLHTSGQDG
jgi:hypothetical protein